MDLGEELDIWRVATGFRLANLPSKIEKYQWSLFCPYNVYGFNKLCRPLVANSNKLHEFCVHLAVMAVVEVVVVIWTGPGVVISLDRQ